MKRSFQEVVELVVFGLIALLIGVGVLWLVGWILGLVGLLMKFLAGLIWWLLRYIVPIAIVAGLIYFLVRVLQGDRSAQAAPATATPPGTGTATATPVVAEEVSTKTTSEEAERPADDAKDRAAGGEAEEDGSSPGEDAREAGDSEGGAGAGGDTSEGDRKHN